MSKIVLCTRCYATPEAPRTTFDHMRGNPFTDTFDPYCSEACMHHSETPIEECARVGLAFMNATMMMHMFLSIGRETDAGFQIIQARRVLQTERLQYLATLDELKEIAL